MFTIDLNEKDLISNKYRGLNVKEVAQMITSEKGGHDILSHLFIDDIEIDIENDHNSLEKPVDITKKLQFIFKNKYDLSFEALDSCNEYLDTITSQIKEISTLFQQNKAKEASLKFADCMELIDLFIQLIANVNKNLGHKIKDNDEIKKTLNEAEVHLLSILKSLVPAREKADIIMLCDLLEYELVDNLTQWKIKIVPLLKSLKTM